MALRTENYGEAECERAQSEVEGAIEDLLDSVRGNAEIALMVADKVSLACMPEGPQQDNSSKHPIAVESELVSRIRSAVRAIRQTSEGLHSLHNRLQL